MSERKSEPFSIHRILAAFSPSTASAMALESAVDVAARWGVDLEALFVEDVSLLQLAELPFARQVSLTGGGGRPMLRTDIELQLRALATQAERRLSEAGARRQTRVTFRTTRGQVTAEVSAAAAEVDLLVLDCISRPLSREARVEPPIRALIHGATRSILLLQPGRPPGGPVHVVVESREGARRTIHAAAELATRYASPLVITTLGAAATRPEPLQRELAAETGNLQVPVHHWTLPETGERALEDLLTAVGGGTLVLAASSPLLESETTWERIARAPCTVLLVR